MIPREGVCYDCSPFRVTCEHVCPTCGDAVDMDNCDGEAIDGRMVGYEGTTQGFKCANGCFFWAHNACGDPKQQLCRVCLSVPA